MGNNQGTCPEHQMGFMEHPIIEKMKRTNRDFGTFKKEMGEREREREFITINLLGNKCGKCVICVFFSGVSSCNTI